jgi:hypothetical protein
MSDHVTLPSGRSMPRDHAESHMAMLYAAAAAVTYVSDREKWPGFTAWAEQVSPDIGWMPSGDLRMQFTLWAAHLLTMARTVEEIVTEGGSDDRE